MPFKKTTAIISGGASGLGKAVCERIALQGGKAAIIDIDSTQAEPLVKQFPNNLIFHKTDISDENQVKQAFQFTAEKWGSINLAVNCAGVLGAGRIIGKKGPMPIDFFKKVVDINLIGSFLFTQSATQHMQTNTPINNERGVIIHTASIAAFEGQLGQVAYSATKSAIIGMVLPTARELAPLGIRCMAIAPGTFETPMMSQVPDKIRQQLCDEIPHPSRFGTPKEFAQLVEQISDNQMLNGSVIRLDAAARLR